MVRVLKLFYKTILFLISIGIIGALMYFGYEFYLKQAYPNNYDQYVLTASDENSVEPSLIYAIIKTESNFKEDAKSKAGAMGVMQIMPATFSWLQTHKKQSVDSGLLYDPEINIDYGTYLLSFLLKKYTSEETAICAYNAGMGTVDNWLENYQYSDDGVNLKNIPYKETASYVKRVIKSREIYRKLYFKNKKTELLKAQS